jgi:hypothetical protein
MKSNKKLPTLLKVIALFVAVNVCLGATQTFADPLTVTGDQKPRLPSASFLDDPLLGSTSLYPFRDAYGYIQNGYPKAHAVLIVPQTSIRQTRQDEASVKESFTVDIRLYNDSSDAMNCYNLYWDSLIPMPGRLALYDSQKRYVCDLLERLEGSQESITAHDWAEVPVSGYVGMLLGASLPYPSYKVIPPGKYYLQVIYFQRVVRPFSETNMRGDTPDPMSQSELFRSNAVPITVIDQSAVTTPRRTSAH